jgi:hypothetical protein
LPKSIGATKAQLTEDAFSALPPSRAIEARRRPVLAFRPPTYSARRALVNLKYKNQIESIESMYQGN